MAQFLKNNSAFHVFLFMGVLCGISLLSVLFEIKAYPADGTISGTLAPYTGYACYVYDIWWNPKLRRDRDSLSDLQRRTHSETTFFNSGRSAQDSLMDGFYPELTEYFLTQIKKSKCYWKPASEKLNFAWEAMALMYSDDFYPYPQQVGGCTGSQADSRIDIINRDSASNLNSFSFLENMKGNTYTMLLEKRASPNVLDECQAGGLRSVTYYHGSVVSPLAGGAQASTFCQQSSRDPQNPICQMDCQIQPQSYLDTQFQLHLMQREDVPSGVGSFNSVATKVASPVIKTVMNSRTLYRPLTPEKPMSPSAVAAFKWAVPLDAQGIAEENFSPDLFISRLEVKAPHPREKGAMISVKPSRIIFGPQVGKCEISKTGASFLNTESCPSLFQVNPYYLHTHPGLRLTWIVEFDQMPSFPSGGVSKGKASFVVAQGNSLPPLFLGFTLQSKTAENAIKVNPSFINFESVDPAIISTAGVVPKTIKVENVSAQPLSVATWIEGRDKNYFQVSPVSTASVVQYFQMAHVPSPPATVTIPILQPYPGGSSEYTVSLQGPIHASRDPSLIQGGVLLRPLEATLMLCYGNLSTFNRLYLPSGPPTCRKEEGLSPAAIRIRAVLGRDHIELLVPPVIHDEIPPYLFSRTFQGNYLSNDGVRSYIRPVMLQNTGFGSGTIESVRFEGQDASAFSIHIPTVQDNRQSFVPSTPWNQALQLGSAQFADFWVEFTPLQHRPQGPYQAALMIEYSSRVVGNTRSQLLIPLQGNTGQAHQQ